ncbi:hypothetical protein BOTBODRAFT_51790 [Botryobasidium botryosum FD-172 SS1]|uniref:LysM domain-containing protein n=1 Tax=Botryobasidium botryosum (strain FD-172 SS1) TaxID=930990 RepID=A0A067MXG3_BOTB1|nr:hypothetical protein BOTBODRAFT_51790 [Botryobasidium botryosum FD-172 SS1]
MSLCLACCSSLPSKSQASLFTTPCCGRPICESCLGRNPRLRRYNPCLYCVTGVAVTSVNRQDVEKELEVNGVGEEDMFVLGDLDDDEDDARYNRVEREVPDKRSDEVISLSSTQELPSRGRSPEPQNGSHPTMHYIKRGDTLLGISLKYGIDGRVLCRLNNLDVSALRTNPQLLHTRRTLLLPPGTSRSPTPPSPSALRELELERSAKRFSLVTKEVDEGVVRAYLSLAEGDDGAFDKEGQEKSGISGTASDRRAVPEGMAVDRYMNDAEWEEAERRAGRASKIQGFPFSSLGKNN